MAVNNIKHIPLSANRQLDLGLRWLDADTESGELSPGSVSNWSEFLTQAGQLPRRHRLPWLRLWPLLAAINGVLAFSGLMVWPNQSGVHLLVFLMVFWLAPLGLMVWTLAAGLILGRTPWWGYLATGHKDRVIALWCARQSFIAQGVFCISGLFWLWLMLATRQVVFYWSTSIEAVSAYVDDLLRTLTLGLVATPEPLAVSASEVGAITGWEAELLQFSYYWALWLTQIVALWVVVPAIVLVGVAQVLLRRRLAHWPDFNLSLRLRYEQECRPSLAFRSLDPEQSATETLKRELPLLLGIPAEPGFIWQVANPGDLPDGSVRLGDADYKADVGQIEAEGRRLERWYIGGQAVPTGDLADLLQHHHNQGMRPKIGILLPAGGSAHIEALQLSWSTFIDRNELPVTAELIAKGEVADNGHS